MLRRLPVRLRGRKPSAEQGIPETTMKPEVKVIAPLMKPATRRKRTARKPKQTARRKRALKKEARTQLP